MTDADYGEFTPITVGSGTTPMTYKALETEVVAWKVSATDRLDQFFETEGEAVVWANSPNVFDSVVTPLVTLASLQAMQARAEKAERERDAARTAFDGLSAITGKIAQERAYTKARVKELERDLDEWKGDLIALGDHLNEQLRETRARVKELEEALAAKEG